MNPPYQITNTILQLITSISENIGEIKATRLQKVPATLRKENRIKTIQSSLEIEGNTLSIKQVTDINSWTTLTVVTSSTYPLHSGSSGSTPATFHNTQWPAVYYSTSYTPPLNYPMHYKNRHGLLYSD